MSEFPALSVWQYFPSCVSIFRFLFRDSGYFWDSVWPCFPLCTSIFSVFIHKFWLLLGQCVLLYILPSYHFHIFGFYAEILVIVGTVCGSTSPLAYPYFRFLLRDFGYFWDSVWQYCTSVHTSRLSFPYFRFLFRDSGYFWDSVCPHLPSCMSTYIFGFY